MVLYAKRGQHIFLSFFGWKKEKEKKGEEKNVFLTCSCKIWFNYIYCYIFCSNSKFFNSIDSEREVDFRWLAVELVKRQVVQPMAVFLRVTLT